MARVRDIEIDEVPTNLQPVYARFARDYGPFLNQVKVFAHRPPALRHIMGLLLVWWNRNRWPIGRSHRWPGEARAAR